MFRPYWGNKNNHVIPKPPRGIRDLKYLTRKLIKHPDLIKQIPDKLHFVQFSGITYFICLFGSN
jgi:hypothetical protein